MCPCSLRSRAPFLFRIVSVRPGSRNLLLGIGCEQAARLQLAFGLAYRLEELRNLLLGMSPAQTWTLRLRASHRAQMRHLLVTLDTRGNDFLPEFMRKSDDRAQTRGFRLILGAAIAQ